MSVEELLLHRYKVINADTSGRLVKGGILTFDDECNVFWCNGEPFTEERIKEFPHLFVLLPWYLERTLEQMPDYVMWSESSDKEVGKIIEWRQGIYYHECRIDNHIGYWNPQECSLIPATEQQYKTFINSQP